MNDRPHLDPRLLLLASQVRPGSCVADIGSDHGYLVTWLVLNGTCPQGIAADINPLPLERSRQTVLSYGVQDRVRLLLSDGLDQLCESDADDIVLAGMGGDLMAQILARANWRRPDQLWHLQPMTKAPHLRQWLCESGYEILRERAVHSGRFCYSVITARRTGMPHPCTPVYALVGQLPADPSEAARDYIRWQASLLLKKASGLEKSASCTSESQTLRLLARQVLQTIGE